MVLPVYETKQQPGKLKPKDLKQAIRKARADRDRQLREQEALRALAVKPEDETMTTTTTLLDTNGHPKRLNPPATSTPSKSALPWPGTTQHQSSGGKAVQDDNDRIGGEATGDNEGTRDCIGAVAGVADGGHETRLDDGGTAAASAPVSTVAQVREAYVGELMVMPAAACFCVWA